MKIGLFGGSFDPPHCGHLALASTALQHLGLDELRWLPAGQPWQRQHQLAAGDHRAAMVEAAIAGVAGFALDRRELERRGPTYTIDTVRELRSELPQAMLFLLIGEDQLQRLPTWREWQALLSEVTLAVAGRGPARAAPQEIQSRLATIERLPMPPMPISSTAIRAHLAAGQPAQALVPDVVPAAVARYIDQHRLYAVAPA